MTNLQKLTLERLAELGQEVMSIHGDLESWREKPYTDVERHQMSMKLEKCLQSQHKLIAALLEDESGEQQ